MSDNERPAWFGQFMAFFGLTVFGWWLRPIFYHYGFPGYGHAMMYFMALMVLAMFGTPWYYETVGNTAR